MKSQVEQGLPLADDDFRDLSSWQGKVAEAAALLGLDPSDASLGRLGDEIASALRDLTARSQDAALAGILEEITALPARGALMALEGPVEAAGGLAPASMDDTEKDLFRALYRVMSSDAVASVDPGDADLVCAQFGMPAFLVAVGALAAERAGPVVEPEPDQPEPEPEPEPELELEPMLDQSAPGPGPQPEPDQERYDEDEPGEDPGSGNATASVPELTDRSAADLPAAARELAEPPVSMQAVLDGNATATGLQPAPSPAEAPPTGGGELDLAADPRIEAAIRAGRTGLAYWYTVALRLPGPVRAAFEVLALSESVAVDGDDPSVRIRELLGDFSVASVARNADYLKVLAAGSARALLRMPFSPCATILYDSIEALTGDADRDFLKAVLEAGSFGFDLSRADDVAAQGVDEFIDQRDAALARLQAVLEAARGARTKYPRASDVLRRVMNDKEPVGRAICVVLAAPEDVAAAEALLAQLRDLKAVDRLIDDTDQRLNPASSRKGKIISGARDQVRSHVDDVLGALRAYVEAARTLDSRHRFLASDQPTVSSAVAALRSMAREADGGPEPAGAGSHAVAQVRAWARDSLSRPGRALAGHASPLDVDLSRAFEVSRQSDGTVEPESVTTEVLAAVTSRTTAEAYAGFAARDDFAGVERLIDALRASGQGDVAERLAARQPDDVKVSRERLRRLADQAGREIELALFAALLSDSESAELGVVLARYRSPDVEGFPVARRSLDDIIARVEAARARFIDEARSQLHELECPAEVRERITRQLDGGDLVTAQEFLAQLRAGSAELPLETPTDPTFAEFWPDFVREVTVLASQADGAGAGWLADAADQAGEIAGLPVLPSEATPAVRRGAEGWLLLTREMRGGPWERWLKDVLYLLGFEVRGPFPHRPNRAGQWTTRIEAELVGRALVPAYGSSAEGHYQLLLCWDKRTPEQIQEMVEELPRQAPILVLYFDTLSQRDRRTLAERSRANDTSAVVIDHAVMAFLVTRTGARLQTTMGLTLPFTAINPYTPFVLGDVPREVFYGRRRELHDVQDANGPLFVYGGRQLGKSSLLKTAMREFAGTGATWRSIYIDLKAEGIGERRVSDDLWTLLVPRLREAGIITDRKVSEKAPPDVVVNHIRDWLNEDAGRRFLLLLDEADAFLETDARARPGQAGDSRFVNVYRLKNLMDGSNRRFKPVFAGLHQVQRFHSVSNGPMAHVGAEILIGPLPPGEAYKLVVEPLATIGYQVERPDVVWRLLAYTNYQASLIQAFCNALVRRMHDRKLAQDSPPTIIRDRDIEEVYGDREVRDWIASRFELTINLDNRYRVIAYTTAFLTNSTHRQAFEVGTLYDNCKVFWPTGFTVLNLDDFTAYLDEMVGLGVLVRTTSDEYGIRSPNVIRLLGSPSEIDRRLQESEDVLEVSSLFDPAVFRRHIGADPDRRSPLTEQQVQQTLEGRRQLHVIVGTVALGLDRVEEALRTAAPEDITVHPVTCGSLHAAITSLSRARSGRHHLVLDLAGSTEAEQRSAVRRLHAFASGNDRRTASCLAPPSAGSLWAHDLPGIQFRRLHLTPWAQDTLRAWAPECQYPLSTADDRRLLLEETGGWPMLVEKAAQAARSGHAQAGARQEALSLLASDESAAAFLGSVGIPGDIASEEVIAALVDYSDEITFDELATLVAALPPAEVNLVVERLMDLGVLGNGSKPESYRLNPLIAQLLQKTP
ncbi:MAG TPA: hypothetical protein VH478_07500 [Trebonia sp.]|nr:hypothetical protein [Trebonia sp.]